MSKCVVCGRKVDAPIDSVCGACFIKELVASLFPDTNREVMSVMGMEDSADNLATLNEAVIKASTNYGGFPSKKIPDVDSFCARVPDQIIELPDGSPAKIIWFADDPGKQHPPCYNREAFTDPNAGWRDTGRSVIRVNKSGHAVEAKPVLRYRWPWFVNRCATHDGTGVGPNGENYPTAHGWDCEGCRWKP